MSIPKGTPRCGTFAARKRSTPRLFEVSGAPAVVHAKPNTALCISADVAIRIGSDVMIAAGIEQPMRAEQLPRSGLVVSTVNPERRGIVSVSELT